jgi:hypothetical protein
VASAKTQRRTIWPISAVLLLGLAGVCMAFAPVDRNVSTEPAAEISIAVTQTAEPAEPDIGLRPSLDGPDRVVFRSRERHVWPIRGGMERWASLIAEASARFDIPQSWIRSVMKRESGGASVMARSRDGAVGLMQLMPETYRELRRQYGLGANPYDPHDNIIAATAYLKWLEQKYGYPNLFAAYNSGPGMFDRHLQSGRELPRETRDYVAVIASDLHRASSGANMITISLRDPPLSD